MKFLYSLLFILFLLTSSCGTISLESPTYVGCFALFNNFFNLPVKEQEIQFSQYDLERQYFTYICGMQRYHPPAIYLARSFAKKGNAAVGFLKKKLVKTENDSSIRNIIKVFYWMQLDKTYEVNSDKDLLQLLKSQASEINDQFWRTQTQGLILDIEASSQKSNNTQP